MGQAIKHVAKITDKAQVLLAEGNPIVKLPDRLGDWHKPQTVIMQGERTPHVLPLSPPPPALTPWL